MSLTAVNIYLCANALLITAVIVLSSVAWASRRLRHPVAYRHLLWIGYGLTIAALLLPLIKVSAPRDVLPPAVQVWSAPSMNSGEPEFADHRITMPLVFPGNSLSLSAVQGAAAILLLAGMLALLIRLMLDGAAIIRIVAGAQTVRRHHGLRLLVSDGIRVPFSVWAPRARIVVIPSALLLRFSELQLAIRHEIQHHRQHDTVWLYLYPLLKAAFFWNPAAHILTRRIRELQELACDSAVVARRNVSAGSYCSSLVWVAEHSMGSISTELTASMNGNAGRNFLKRRVAALLAGPTLFMRGAWVLSISVVAMTLMTGVAIVSAATVQDRRISIDDARRMASTTPEGGIPIPINEAVLAQLNRLLATPDGREDLIASLSRMRHHEAMLATKLAENDLPVDLLAVPLVESGYRNLEQSGDPGRGAGLWMFLAPTARKFDLAVTPHRDERLDPEMETGAALRMFSSQYSRYRDWGLTLLAFNCGVGCVDSGVQKAGTRDVWRIVAKGFENDPNYVAQTMAAMLVLRNPSVLD